jgi:hypothetical protein
MTTNTHKMTTNTHKMTTNTHKMTTNTHKMTTIHARQIQLTRKTNTAIKQSLLSRNINGIYPRPMGNTPLTFCRQISNLDPKPYL